MDWTVSWNFPGLGTFFDGLSFFTSAKAGFRMERRSLTPCRASLGGVGGPGVVDPMSVAYSHRAQGPGRSFWRQGIAIPDSTAGAEAAWLEEEHTDRPAERVRRFPVSAGDGLIQGGISSGGTYNDLANG